MSDADQASPDVLRQKAHGELLSRQAMIDQVTLTFAANSRKTPLGSFFVGDTANVTRRVEDHPRRYPTDANHQDERRPQPTGHTGFPAGTVGEQLREGGNTW